MKLFKALSQSIINLLDVINNITQGTNELSLMYKDVCTSARQEQALESLADLTALAEKTGISQDDLKTLQAAM